jgi:hypothetical protein
LLLQMVSRFKLAEGETAYAMATPATVRDGAATEVSIPQPIRFKPAPSKLSSTFTGVHGTPQAAGAEWKEF